MIQVSFDTSTLSSEEAHALAGFLINLSPLPEGKSFDVVRLDSQIESVAPAPADSDDEVAARSFGFAGAADNVVQMTTPPSVDASGLPWDERIHASSKATTEAGLWRKKRGLQEGEAERVEAELRKLMAIPSPTSGVPATQIPSETPTPSADTSPIVPPPPVEIPAPVVPVPPPPVNNVEARQPFIELLNVSSQAIGAGKITIEDVNAITKRHGVDALPLLNVRLDLVPAIRSEVDLLIASKG